MERIFNLILYRIRTDEGYQFVNTPTDEARSVLDRLDGSPQKGAWKPVIVELVRENLGKGLHQADLSSLGTAPLILRATAVDAMRDIWEANGEILPLSEVRGEELFAFNSQAIDALDEENSEIVRFKSSGRIMDVPKPVFYADKLEGVDIFHRPGAPSVQYVNQRFVDAVRENGLRGIVFKKCWKSKR